MPNNVIASPEGAKQSAFKSFKRDCFVANAPRNDIYYETATAWKVGIQLLNVLFLCFWIRDQVGNDKNSLFSENLKYYFIITVAKNTEFFFIPAINIIKPL